MKEILYVFIIDTDSYSGNFEREMCAYITGQAGDCGVGVEQIDFFEEEESQALLDDFDMSISLQTDEHGVQRPCATGATPGWGNDGEGNMIKLENDADRKMYPYPAAQSVEIYFDKIPTLEMQKIMVERANKFTTREKIGILSFRMIERITITVDKEIWAE